MSFGAVAASVATAAVGSAVSGAMGSKGGSSGSTTQESSSAPWSGIQPYLTGGGEGPAGRFDQVQPSQEWLDWNKRMAAGGNMEVAPQMGSRQVHPAAQAQQPSSQMPAQVQDYLLWDQLKESTDPTVLHEDDDSFWNRATKTQQWRPKNEGLLNQMRDRGMISPLEYTNLITGQQKSIYNPYELRDTATSKKRGLLSGGIS